MTGTQTTHPDTLTVVEEHRCHGGRQLLIEHDSAVLGCTMRLAVFLPAQAQRAACPVLLYLSGLTCSEQNATTKAGAQRMCAEHGLILVCPDTSPRGNHVPDSPDWDLGQGAGFYLSATRQPWSRHFRMDRYVLEEVPALVSTQVGTTRWGITGHSMGGHGAIVLALRNPGRFASVSAFSPILQPSDVPWGQKAFGAYLGDDPETWAEWDATALLTRCAVCPPMLIDQGGSDSFLEPQLKCQRFLAAAGAHPVEYRLQPGYDHSYYFVSSFIDEHVDWHARHLLA